MEAQEKKKKKTLLHVNDKNSIVHNQKYDCKKIKINQVIFLNNWLLYSNFLKILVLAFTFLKNNFRLRQLSLFYTLCAALCAAYKFMYTSFSYI